MSIFIHSTPLNRVLFFLVFDMLLSFLSLLLAYHLRFNFVVEAQYSEHFFLVFGFLLFFKLLGLAYFKLYHISWRFVSLSEVKKIVYAHIFAYSAFICLFYIFPHLFLPFPRSVLLIDFSLSLLFIGALRLAKRLFVEGGENNQLQKTLLIGASSFAQTLLKQKNDFYISAVVDDDKMLVNSHLNNIQVNHCDQIEEIIQRDGIEAVIISRPFSQGILTKLYTRLNALGIYNIKTVSLENQESTLKNITVEDLLARHPQDLDLESIEAFIKGKSILITGAGGSIGSEISRQCQAMGAKSLTLVDNSEFNLYQIGEDIAKARLALVSVTDKPRLEKIFEEAKADIVIHAAAYKHVPLCEANQETAVFNNVQGTINVIDLSIAFAVPKLVIISTDKAVRPTNVMGASKRVTELYANNVPSFQTQIVAVRFGNVLGSSGSVIPKFKAQIEAGQDITVTHPDITRYFMLIPEACQLVLQTATIAKGGELFILDMGEPVKIVDLAQKMIQLYGKEDELKIVFTGLRAGEKLYEELLLDQSEQKTKYRSIFIAKPTTYDIVKLNADIEALLKANNKVIALQKIVPEFTREPML